MEKVREKGNGMKQNRRFKVFIIWLIDIKLLIILLLIFPKTLDSALIADLAKYSTILAVLAIVGFSGVHMMYDWAKGRNGRRVGDGGKGRGEAFVGDTDEDI